MLSSLQETARRLTGGRRGIALGALASALLAVGVSGCGSAQPLTKKQLISRANAACLKLHQRVKKLGPVKTPEDFVHLTTKLAGFEQQQLEEMRKLVPPKQLSSDWKQILEGIQEVSEGVATVGTDMQAKDKKAQQEAVKQTDAVIAKVSAIAKRDGFDQCVGIG